MRDLIVSQQELAAWLCLSSRRIRELTRAGILQRDKHYSLRSSVRSYVQFLRTESGSLTDERARLVKSQADLSELKLKQRTGELVEWAVIEKAIFALHRQLRDNFLNLPPRCDALVAAESDQRKCFDILNKEVLQILTGLSDGLQKDRDVDSHAERRPLAGGRGADARHDQRGAGRDRGQD